jgi:hypothetical protein
MMILRRAFGYWLYLKADPTGARPSPVAVAGVTTLPHVLASH